MAQAIVLEASPVAQVLVDPAGIVIVVNDRARALFGLRESDVGRPLHELELSYRPVELRSLVQQAHREGRAISVKDVEWRSGVGEARWLDLHVSPLHDQIGSGTMITFTEVTSHHRLQQELAQSRQELETAYEELQSANEELETTNEELQTINDELRPRGDQLSSATTFLESVLASLRGGVAVVDRELRLTAWSRHAEELWGLREEEVTGRHL